MSLSEKIVNLRLPQRGPAGHAAIPFMIDLVLQGTSSCVTSQSTVDKSSIPNGDSNPSISDEAFSKAGKNADACCCRYSSISYRFSSLNQMTSKGSQSLMRFSHFK